VAGVAAVLGVVPLIALERRRLDAPPRARDVGGRALNRNIVLLTIWGAVFVSGQFGLLAFIALDLHQRRGLALAAGSLLAVLAQAGGVAGRVGWGLLSDRLLDRGRKPLLLVLTAVAFTSILLLAVLPDGAPIGAYVAVVLLAGVGVIGFQGLWVTLIVEAAEPARVGAATGAATAGLLLVAGAAIPLYGLIADVSGSYRAVWLTLAGALLCSLVPAMMVREVRTGRAVDIVD
jgi:MFS family permease